MTWIALLLADPSPCLRLLVLRDLLARDAADGEVQELAALRQTDPIVADLAVLQDGDGSWQSNDLAGLGVADPVQATSQALLRLAYLGFGAGDAAVIRGADYLFSQQQEDGAWPLRWGEVEEGANEGYALVPLQTALPLRALALSGYATDARCERAYEWLLAQRLPDGAWPTGIAAGTFGRVAGYRRLAHSRWGCRSNTTGALACLALHPQRRTSAEAQRALDLLLGRETHEAHTLGFETARLIGAEPTRGFLTRFARSDPAQMLDLCWRVRAGAQDERIGEMVAFVRGRQGAYGLWEYAPQPQASRWVTFDLLRSLSRLEGSAGSDWFSLEPRTPFQAYPRLEKRF